MSVLESIRKRAGLFVVLFVGFALLAFILQGSLDTGFGFLGGNDQNNLGSINDHKIKRQDYELAINKIESKYLERNPQSSSVPPEFHTQVMGRIWAEYLDKYLYEPQYKSIGLAVAPAEVQDFLWGRNISPQISQIQLFVDTLTGQFSPAKVKEFVENISEDETEDAAATQGVTYDDWVEFESGLIADRKRQKYNTIVTKGFYVTTAEAKRNFEFQNKNAQVKFVVKKYASVADSTIKVTEEDIKKAYEENKFRFRVLKGQRRIDLVTFDITPSQEDVENVKKTVELLIPQFRDSKNDTAFAQANSDNLGAETFKQLIKGQNPTPYDSAIYSAAPGTVLGPYIENSSYKLIKVIGRTDSTQVKARHILFSKDKYSIAQGKVKADSVLKLVRAGGDFATLARQLSDDTGSGQQGGDLGFFERNRMVKPFADAAFNGRVGDLVVVETQFGIHLIEIQQRENPLQTVSIEKKITAGGKTTEAIYAKATDFAANNNTVELFEKTAKAKGYQVRPYLVNDGDKDVAGIPNSREMAIWIQDKAKKGEVSTAMVFDDKYVVACVKEVRKKGIPELEDIRSEVELIAKQNAKAEKFAKELQAAAAGATTIDQVAAKANLPVEAAGVTYNAVFIPGSGREAELIGTLTTMKPGQMTKVIKGQNGVYIAYVEAVNDLQPAANYNAAIVKQQYVNMLRQRAGSEINNVLEDKGEIVDNRYRFY